LGYLQPSPSNIYAFFYRLEGLALDYVGIRELV
jgi:hypothetical protein